MFCGVLALTVPTGAAAQELVSFATQDEGIVYADVYGTGERGVVLAHGGRFNRESWATQAQALAAAGFRAVAIDFRGRGQSHDMQQQPGVHRTAEAFEGFRPSPAARSTISSGCEAPVRKVKLVVTALLSAAD